MKDSFAWFCDCLQTFPTRNGADKFFDRETLNHQATKTKIDRRAEKTFENATFSYCVNSPQNVTTLDFNNDEQYVLFPKTIQGATPTLSEPKLVQSATNPKIFAETVVGIISNAWILFLCNGVLITKNFEITLKLLVKTVFDFFLSLQI